MTCPHDMTCIVVAVVLSWFSLLIGIFIGIYRCRPKVRLAK